MTDVFAKEICKLFHRAQLVANLPGKHHLSSPVNPHRSIFTTQCDL
jgi:hypothetical protein